MNEQMAQFANLIQMAKVHSEGAIALLRSVCAEAAGAAPPTDLIRMAELLYEIRAEAARKHIEGN